MTKKTQKIVETYESKLDLYVTLYRENFRNLESTFDWIREENNKFEAMLSSMFSYNLISENDYRELTLIPYELADKAREKCWEIRRKRKLQDEVA